MKHFLVAGMLAAALISVKTYAQEQPQQQRPKHDREGFFKKIDTDGDGKLSKAEVDTAADKDGKGFTRLKEKFGAIDSNKDGFIDKEELKAFRKSQGPRSKEGSSK
ncbi:EF-hand domain-containing protein [Chitinophaga solisilvae]|uniref:EF-hand domain-containing protein n=1 Tax=Chitinophaga solisilvae TaxID=1233460 RepID=A0A9Q5CZC6_9BACT|nr:EF-hand domain-containing protein [Chitinophaga solisilvae]NSL85299.1 EF-hand domain-containing protein [Chitinophaga solisilvae]